jgi:hypothetical protein
MPNGHHLPERPQNDYTFPDWVFPLAPLNAALSERGFAEAQSHPEGVDREHDICIRILMRSGNQPAQPIHVENQIIDIIEHIEGARWQAKCCVACICGQQISAKVIVRHTIAH